MKFKQKICVVGAGKWGMNHIKTLHSLGALSGVVEMNNQICSEIKDKYPLCKVFSKLNDTFKYDFDGYVVATPAETHYDLANQIISERKSLLVEKPFTLDYNSAVELCRYAERMKVKIMAGHVLLFHPAFQKIKEIIDSGIVGEIQYVYSNRLNMGTFRNNENVFWSFAPHDIALFNYFFDQKLDSIISSGIDILQEKIHDTSITSFNYNGKKMGHIFVSWLHPFKEHRFVVIGSNGMLHFEDSVKGKPLLFYDKKAKFIDSIPNPIKGDVMEIKYNKEQPLKNELIYFLEKIANGGKIEVSDGRSASEVIKILEKATESLNEKRVIKYE